MNDEATKEATIPFAEAKDGKRFDANSPQVKEYMEKYPDATLEVALGSVVMNYNRETLGEDGEERPEASPEESSLQGEEGTDQPVPDDSASEADPEVGSEDAEDGSESGQGEAEEASEGEDTKEAEKGEDEDSQA